MLDARLRRVGRDPATVWRTLGLYALCGEDERDLERRFERLAGERRRRACSTASTSTTFRTGRLVGTVDEVREQVGDVGGSSASTR